MTELDFYKWMKKYDPQYRWEDRNGKKDVVLWISIGSLESFFNLLNSASLFDDGGIEVRLQDRVVAIWASDILHHFGIDLEGIFEPNE